MHAEHTVIVRTAMPDSGNSLEWREVSITNRVNVQVRRHPSHTLKLHLLSHWGRSLLMPSTRQANRLAVVAAGLSSHPHALTYLPRRCASGC